MVLEEATHGAVGDHQGTLDVVAQHEPLQRGADALLGVLLGLAAKLQEVVMVGADHVVRVDGAVKAAKAHLHEAVHQLVASLGNAGQRNLERLSRPAQRRAEDVVELDA